MGATELHIGIVGAGGFAKFAIRAFLKAPGVKVIAVTDIDKNAAAQMRSEFGLMVYGEFDQMLASKDIDLIYVATPPFLHFAQSKMALLAGKHVICEKPAALKTSEAEALLALAHSAQLLFVVNLVQRYNPLFDVVGTIVQEEIFGHFVHGYFENYASDENLSLDHWFWDVAKSGGIFIEHGVHFFDLFEGWLGHGRMAGAWELQRSDTKAGIVDRVQATVLYKKGIVNFYHGFNQPNILDRQEMRLQFERGDITLYEWIPVKMTLHGLLSTDELKRLQDLMETITIVHKDGEHTRLDYENALGKLDLYQKMLTDMITDQWKWIRDHGHKRVIDGNNAVRSLEMAERAHRIAIEFAA